MAIGVSVSDQSYSGDADQSFPLTGLTPKLGTSFTSAAINDVAFVVLGLDSAFTAPDAADGMTSQATFPLGDEWIGMKVLNATDISEGDIDISLPANNSGPATLIVVRGLDPAAPVEKVSSVLTSSGGSPTTPAQMPNGTDRMILGVAFRDASGQPTSGITSGTLLSGTSPFANAGHLMVGGKIQTAAVNEGIPFTSSDSGGYIVVTLVLKPDASGGGGAPTLFLDTGFESDFAGLTTSSPAPDIETVIVYAGAKAMRVNPAATSEFAGLTLDATKTRLVGRHVFRPLSLPSGSQNTMRVALSSGGTKRVFLRLYSNGQFDMEIRDVTTALAAESAQSPVGTSAYIVVDYDINASANPWVINWRINGVAQTPVTVALAAGTLINAHLGNVDTGGSPDFLYDEWALSYTAADYPIGDPGGGGGTANPKVSTLVDNFDDNSIDTAKWTAVNPDALVRVFERNQRLEIELPASTPVYRYLGSNGRFDLTDSNVFVRLFQIPSVGSTDAEFETWVDANSGIIMGAGHTSVWWGKRVGGVWTQTGSATYNATNHAWLRIRESAGTIYFDRSADGVTWVNLGTTTVPFAVTDVQVRLVAGNYSGTNSAQTVIYDSLGGTTGAGVTNPYGGLSITETFGTDTGPPPGTGWETWDGEDLNTGLVAISGGLKASTLDLNGAFKTSAIGPDAAHFYTIKDLGGDGDSIEIWLMVTEDPRDGYFVRHRKNPFGDGRSELVLGRSIQGLTTVLGAGIVSNVWVANDGLAVEYDSGAGQLRAYRRPGLTGSWAKVLEIDDNAFQTDDKHAGVLIENQVAILDEGGYGAITPTTPTFLRNVTGDTPWPDDASNRTLAQMPVTTPYGTSGILLGAAGRNTTWPPPTSGGGGTPSFPSAYFVGDYPVTGFPTQGSPGNPRGFIKYERLHDLTLPSNVVALANPSGFPNVAKAVVRELYGPYPPGTGTGQANSTNDDRYWYGSGAVGSGGDTSGNGDASFWGRNAPKTYEQAGQTAWYRFWFLIPNNTDARYPGNYRPPGRNLQSGWSTLMNWHENDPPGGPFSSHIGISPAINGAGLRVRSSGGTGSTGGVIDFHEKHLTPAIPYNTWVEVLVMQRNSTYKAGTTDRVNPDGRMEVYRNGVMVFPTADMPASWRSYWYQTSDAGVYLQIGHYRASPIQYVGLSADYEDTVYLGPVIIGPTRASVGA